MSSVFKHVTGICANWFSSFLIEMEDRCCFQTNVQYELCNAKLILFILSLLSFYICAFLYIGYLLCIFEEKLEETSLLKPQDFEFMASRCLFSLFD